MSKNKKQNDLPEENYYVGKEYISDLETKEVLIKCSLRLPIILKTLNFDISKDLHLRAENGILYINLHRIISNKLFEDLSLDNFKKAKERNDLQFIETPIKAGKFIIGYIQEILPLINDEIKRSKYLEGHLLYKNFSVADLFDVYVTDKIKWGYVPWPIPIAGFPSIAPNNSSQVIDKTYIRDLIDAMTAYLYYDVDEGIKKIITSLDNFFFIYNINDSKNSRILNLLRKFGIKTLKNSFRNKIKNFLSPNKWLQSKQKHLNILRDNILYIYHLRNQVTHNDLRIKSQNRFILKKGIGTLCYFYQANIINQSEKEYIFNLKIQFLAIEEIYSGLNLNQINLIRQGSAKSLMSKEDLDDWMFEGLKIVKQDKDRINL